MILGLTIQGWVTIIVLLVLVVMNIYSKISPAFLSFGGLLLLMITGAVSEETAMAGFGSESVLVTATQDIVVVGLVQSGALIWVVQRLLGRPSNYSVSVLRLMLPTALVSAFVDNMMVIRAQISVIKLWARKIKISPSKLLIPASYATLLGGSLTILGNPGNIIIATLYQGRTGNSMGIFSITLPALCCFILTMAVFMFLKDLIPERKSPDETFAATRDYTVEFLLPTDNPVVGRTVAEANLNNVPGGHLIEIVRFDEEIISPVPDDEFLLGGDHLIYTGEVDEILNLKRTHGLVNAAHHVFSVDEIDKNRQLRTATVRYNSTLVGNCMSQTTFEKDNNLVLVAISREGERTRTNPRNTIIQPGDTLLLECQSDIAAKQLSQLKRDLEFFDSEDTVTITPKTGVAGLILLGMVLLAATNVLTLFEASLLAVVAMLVFRCCTPSQAAHGLEMEILVVMACSISFGRALEINGISDILANAADVVAGGNPTMMLFVLTLGVLIMTEFFENSVTAALMFPIAYECAMCVNISALPYMVATMIAVSASYASPYGSPVNMAVFSAGGYRTRDFFKVGLPLKVATLLSIMLVIPLFYF